MQYCNDVFQCGGYITVAEFIEKYKSSFDFNFESEPVTAETLNIGIEPNIKDSVDSYDLGLEVIPKFTVNGKKLISAGLRRAYIVNPTDKEIPLSECYISFVNLGDYHFFQKALMEEITNVPEFIKGLGYEEIRISVKYGGDLKPSMEYNKKFARDGYGNYWFYEVGETNAFGAKPLYKYRIISNGRVGGLDNIGYIFE